MKKAFLALSIGVACLALVNICFYFSSKFFLELASDVDNLNDNSVFYLILGFLDSFIISVSSFIALSTLKIAVKLNRSSYFLVIAAQIPISLGFFLLNGLPIKFSSFYEIQQSMVTSFGLCALFLLFIFTIYFYSKYL